MPKYRVVKTETATVIATNEDDAESEAIEFFANYPDADYEIEKLTPEHHLNEIADALKALGASVYVDDFRNNTHDFLRVSVTHAHPDDDEEQFNIFCSLDDQEEFDGEKYTLDRDGEVIADYPHEFPPTLLASVFHNHMLADVAKRTPTPNTATLEAIGEHLTALGETVRVHYEHRFEGQKPWLEIGAYDEEDGCHEFTLYYQLEDGDGDDIGLGWFITNDCRNLVPSDISNTTPEAVAYIAKGFIMARRAGN